MNDPRTSFSRRSPNPTPSPERSGLSPVAGNLHSSDAVSLSRLVQVQFHQRSIGASPIRAIAPMRGVEIGELGAFMSLGVAGCAAILLTIIANLEFPRAMDQVARRLSAPPGVSEIGRAVIGLSAFPTNPPASRFEAITNGGAGLPTGSSLKPTAGSGMHAPFLPRPSV